MKSLFAIIIIFTLNHNIDRKLMNYMKAAAQIVVPIVVTALAITVVTLLYILL